MAAGLLLSSTTSATSHEANPGIAAPESGLKASKGFDGTLYITTDAINLIIKYVT